jgi:hypothetical protein
MTKLVLKFADSNSSQAIDVCKLFDIVSSLLCADVDVHVRLSPEFLSVKMFVPKQLSGSWTCYEDLVSWLHVESNRRSAC